jgi:uncharacterized protein (DUF4415 family)
LGSKKNRRNVTRHGIAFEDAIKIFEEPTLEQRDDRFDYGEVRVYAIGVVSGIEITVIYTDVPHVGRRIISAWRQSDMKEKRTGTTSAKESSNWKRLQARTDSQIRRAITTDPDAQPTDVNFWKGARVVMPKAKETITIRLDTDLLEWFRKQKGYQTRMNAVLRSYMQGHLPPRRQKPNNRM